MCMNFLMCIRCEKLFDAQDLDPYTTGYICPDCGKQEKNQKPDD